MPPKRILIVDDERDLVEMVAARLRQESYEVAIAYDGLDALRQVQSDPPDLVLLDLMLPGLSGTDVAAEIRRDPNISAVPIVMLTARTDESDVVVGLRLGADDYITKPFSMSVLVARVAAVLRRAAATDASVQSVLRAGAIQIDKDRHRVDVDGKEITLTLTEFRLLLAIVAGRGRVLTRNQLIDQALGPEAMVTDRTIDVHVTALRRKLGKARYCIQTVRGVGYRLATEGRGK